MKLKNRIIVITGGTSGIGLALANYLKKENTIIVLGRNKEKLAFLKEKGIETFECDISVKDSLEKTIVLIENKFDHIDVLFNNAGLQHNYIYTDSNYMWSAINEELSVNVTGQIAFTQLMLPLLSNSDKALIINVTSALGIIPKRDGLIYSASKAAMRNFTFGLRKSLQDSNIDVVELIPPVTDTKMTQKRDEKKMSPKFLVEKLLPQIESGRRTVTIGSIRYFSFIACLFPSFVHSLVNKG